MRLDRFVFDLLHRGVGRRPLLDGPTLACARFGSCGEVGLMLLVGLRHGPAGRDCLARCVLAVSFVYALVEAIGSLTARARPFAAHPNARAMLRHAPGRSFPSRHVASAVAMGVIAGPTAARTSRAMLLLAFGLGLARVRAGLHYPSDIVAGAVLGHLVGRLLRPR